MESLDSGDEVEQVGYLSENEGRQEDVMRGIEDGRGRYGGRRIWYSVVNVEREY